MTPKEKAYELIVKALVEFEKLTISEAKKIALIAVDEIITEITEIISPSIHGFRHRYWNEVKQEIEKL